MSSTSTQLGSDLQVDVAAMAGIVRELVACKQNGQCDPAWLRQRTTAERLSEHAYTALEALRVHIHERQATLDDHVTLDYWK